MRGFRRLIPLMGGLAQLAPAYAADPVSAELGKKTAWTGEGVPLSITLRSPGPFSGTASFEFPELPKTWILKVGRPVVGSEEAAGETLFTQRHPFMLYTQQTGEITIPPFRVRFEGKRTFTSDPESMGGETAALRFLSKRPPGTEGMGVVVATTEMKITQSWSPPDVDAVQAGDVIERTITQSAAGTTAMMLAPASPEAPQGIRIHLREPALEDAGDRGAARARRTDTIKYQFEKAGTFSIPEQPFVWWNPGEVELKREILPGTTSTVEGSASTPAAPGARRDRWIATALILLVLGLAGWLAHKPVARCFASWRARHRRPENKAARDLLRACQSDDAPAAYAALGVWTRSVQPAGDGLDQNLERERATLSRLLFGATPDHGDWSGDKLARAFRRQRRLSKPPPSSKSTPLPPLNPG